MAKQKSLEQLRAEKEQVEKRLAQEGRVKIFSHFSLQALA